MSATLQSVVSAPALSEDEARSTAVDAYVYFYSLVTMEVPRKQMTNMQSGEKPGFGPMNAFHHIPTMRLYSPESAALTGKWNPPPVRKTESVSSMATN
jgi:hypothetical protein